MKKITWDEVYGIVTERRRNYTPLIEHMHEVTQRYDGDYVIPLPGGAEAKKLPPLAPSIISETVDHMAMHAGSVRPGIFCPPSNGTSNTSVTRARTRSRALRGTWDENYIDLTIRKAVRQLTGYSTFSMVVWPDSKVMRPKIELRDPLGALPEERASGNFDPPNNCAFIHPMPAQDVLTRWGHAHVNVNTDGVNGVITDADVRHNEVFDIVEWWDHNTVIFGVYGRRQQYRHAQRANPHGGNMHLQTFSNKAGVCPVVTPKRISLGDVSSQVAAILGQVDLIGYMAALDLLASQKLLYPDRFVVGRSGVMPKLANQSGKWNEGQDGEPNIILNAEQVGTLPGTVDPSVKVASDRVERNVRNQVGLIPQFGGETYGALRTGRAIDTLGSFATDARLEEIHAILEVGLTQMNDFIHATWTGYYGSRKFTYFTGVESDDSFIEFIPERDVENTQSVVNYPIRGMNTSTLTAELSQMLAAGALDLDSYREMHPHVKDAEGVKRKTKVNEFEQAAMAMLPQMITEGGVIASDIQAGIDSINAGKSTTEAINAIQEAATKRIEEEQQAALEAQQQQGLPPAPGLPPGGAPLPPEAGPGPVGQAPAGPESQLAPNPDQRALFNLIGATRAGLRG